MRYLVLLQKCPQINAEFVKDAGKSTGTSDTTQIQPYHIFDKDIYDKEMLLTKMYDANEMLKKNYKKILKFIHPFDTIGSTVRSAFIPNCPPLKMTNAFMKMYEFLEFIDKYLPKEGVLRMYDVAGAPGMFVIATEFYLNHSVDKSNLTLDWHACSLTGDETALTDLYRLYEHNPERFEPCNVLVESDIRRCMSKGKFDLVTGDIGTEHDKDFSRLQEETHLDLQWGQMILALNLTQKGSIMYLKMYSYVTEESHFLVDTLTQYFEFVYLCKPFTSRLVNHESYIICINRNDKDCSSLPLTRPKLNSYKSTNLSIISTFESTRSDYKIQIVSLISRILEAYPNTTMKSILQNYQYKIYYNQLKRLNFLFYGINKNKYEIKAGNLAALLENSLIENEFNDYFDEYMNEMFNGIKREQGNRESSERKNRGGRWNHGSKSGTKRKVNLAEKYGTANRNLSPSSSSDSIQQHPSDSDN